MHQLVQKIVRLHAGEETVALREQELLAYVKARAEFLWEGWVRQETRWELVPLVALAWHWLHRGANQGVYLANQAFGSLRNLGHFAETEPLIRRALALEEARFGLNHPNVAICLNNLIWLRYCMKPPGRRKLSRFIGALWPFTSGALARTIRESRPA